MNKKEAGQIILQALSTIRATVAEHNTINEAFRVLTAPEVKEEPIVEKEIKDEE